jgi:hypothetical protein
MYFLTVALCEGVFDGCVSLDYPFGWDNRVGLMLDPSFLHACGSCGLDKVTY